MTQLLNLPEIDYKELTKYCTLEQYQKMLKGIMSMKSFVPIPILLKNRINMVNVAIDDDGNVTTTINKETSQNHELFGDGTIRSLNDAVEGELETEEKEAVDTPDEPEAGEREAVDSLGELKYEDQEAVDVPACKEPATSKKRRRPELLKILNSSYFVWDYNNLGIARTYYSKFSAILDCLEES